MLAVTLAYSYDNETVGSLLGFGGFVGTLPPRYSRKLNLRDDSYRLTVEHERLLTKLPNAFSWLARSSGTFGCSSSLHRVLCIGTSH